MCYKCFISGHMTFDQSAVLSVHHMTSNQSDPAFVKLLFAGLNQSSSGYFLLVLIEMAVRSAGTISDAKKVSL